MNNEREIGGGGRKGGRISREEGNLEDDSVGKHPLMVSAADVRRYARAAGIDLDYYSGAGGELDCDLTVGRRPGPRSGVIYDED